MTATGIRERLAKLRSHPVSFLLSINIACAVLGLAQFAFTLSVLLPADFAVIGVLAALGGVVIGFLDVKLADLTTKLYYETDKADLSGRAALLSASLWLHLAAGFCTAAATFVVSLLLARRFLSQEMAAWWAAAMAARIGIAFPVTAAVTFMRLTGDFRASGWTRLATQIAVTLATVACLRASPSLSGYFAAVGVGAALSIAGSLAVAARMTGKTLGHPLLAPPSISAFARYRAGSFLVGGSLAGLAKLVGRSGDTLVVAAFGGDTTTGLYRVARQAYDNLAGLTDAVHQFYTPTIVDALARGRTDAYRRHRRRLMAIGTVAAVVSVLASWLLLRPIAAAGWPQYLPALPAFDIFAALLVATLGVHGWLWPAVVSAGRVGQFGILALSGAAAQVAAIAVLGATGGLSPASAAATAWLAALINYGPLLAAGVVHRPGHGKSARD